MKRAVAILPVLFLALVHCGKRNIGGQQVGEGEPVKLLVFGAPWCEPCTEELKEFHHTLPKALGGLVARVQLQVYVVTDVNKQEPDDQEVAEYAATMKAQHGIEFPMVKDKWPYEEYRKYFQRPGPIPANVVLDKDNNLLKAFKAGTFKTADVINYLIDVLN